MGARLVGSCSIACLCDGLLLPILQLLLQLYVLLVLLFLLQDLFVPLPTVVLFADHEVLKQAIHEVLAHLLVAALVELEVVLVMVEIPVEAGLEGEAVHDVEFPP